MSPGKWSKTPKHWGMIITFDSLIGGWPTFAQLECRLAELPRTETIHLVAWCNAATRTWDGVGDNKADEQVRNFLFPFWVPQFNNWTRQFGEGFLFHRYTLLWLLRHTLIMCPTAAPTIYSPEQLYRFGEVCLIANDLAFFQTPKALPTDLTVAANMIPNTEYFSHKEEYQREVARTHYILAELAPKASDLRFPALAKRIQHLLGYEINNYIDLTFGSVNNSITNVFTTPGQFQIDPILPEHFSRTSIAPETAARFLESFSGDEATLSTAIRNNSAHKADLTIFRDKPLLRHNNGYIALDAGFVLDKAGKSLFWTAIKNAPSGEREGLLSAWGDLFELYVNNRLEENLGPQSILIPTPVFGDKSQAADAIIVEGRTLILLEYKASTISSAIRYADNPAALEKVLEERFISGVGNGRKGLTQLFNALQRFTGGDQFIDQRTGSMVFPSTVGRIMPVLVHLDNALRTPGIPSYLKDRFDALGRFETHMVEPLTVLPITELEALEGYLPEYGMVAVIESFLGQLLAERSTFFLTERLPILQGKDDKTGTTLQHFDDYLNALLARLFPNEAVGNR
jgi:hypothetical protein